MTAVFAQADKPLVEWDWIWSHLDDIWDATAQHLYLTGMAVGIGIIISLVLAVIALRRPATYPTIIGASGLLYTIPSLALFAFLVPFTGLTNTTALIALVTYTILILVRNIVTGIREVPADIKEAAIGMGYQRRRLFFKIELPLALPVIMAGVRIATVTIVGLVTVTSLLGLGGLGAFILDGFRRSIIFPTEIIVGTVLSVVLAAALDLILLGVQHALTPWANRTGGT